MNYFDNIDNYIEETLSETEQSSFKIALENDTTLQDAYLSRLMEREALRNKIKRAIGEPQRQSATIVGLKPIRFYAMAASVAGLLVIGTLFLYNKQREEAFAQQKIDKIQRDSIRMVFVQDSINKATNKIVAIEDSIQQYEKAKIKSPLQEKANQLFVAYCQSETTESQALAAGESAAILENAKAALKNGDAKGTLSILQDDTLIKDNTQAQWLIAIANLKLNPTLAKQQLEALQKESGLYGDKAEKLLLKLK